MNIKDYGYMEKQEGTIARITSVHRDRFGIAGDFGEGYARLKAGEYYAGEEIFPTAGDFVRIDYIENGDSRILATLPRKTVFTRRDPGPIPREQALAANFDYVFILQSMNHNFNPKRLERYLTLAWQSGATPVILLTKADLIDDYWDHLTQVERVATGVNTHVISAKTGQGLNRLNAYLQPGKTVVLLGSSGVGKSSLVNALAGREIMAVSEIREEDSMGRHTTTHRQLLMLRDRAMVIDTPGMRELGMWEVSQGLGDAFSDVEQFLGKCRFSDCRHLYEPGCAIQHALATRQLDAERWASYQKLNEEAPSKEELLRRKQEWHKSLSKFTKQRKKEIW